MASHEDLDRFRSQIDEIDKQLLDFLGRRFELCLRIGRLKDELQLPMMQPNRITQVLDRIAALSQDRGVSPQFAQAMWRSIIEEACRLESK